MNQKKELREVVRVIGGSLRNFIAQYENESDRAMVILCAARTDFLLKRALQSRLLPIPSRRDELLDSDRALGAFSSRIDMSYRLGLIDRGFCRAMHILRKMRNDFAHDVGQGKLSDGSHKDRLAELIQPIKAFGIYQTVKGGIEETIGSGVGPERKDFTIVTSLILSRLELMCEYVKPLKPEAIMSFAGPIGFFKSGEFFAGDLQGKQV